MKGLKSTTISILAVGLLAGSAVGVAGQEATGPAYVTGTITVSGECTEADDWFECPIAISDSDPRLSGDGLLRNSDAAFPFDGGGGVIVIVNQSLRVENADGAWTGGGLLFALPGPDEAPFGADQPTWVLTGEDAYDGWTAVLRPDFDGPAGAQFGGVIFEGDLQAAPPPPESAE